MKTLVTDTKHMFKLSSKTFKPNEKVAVITEGDTLIIKKLNMPKLSSIAQKVRQRPISMTEIVREVHRYRRERRDISH